ncbi:hypothetical protein CANINC_003653 [Pichia inconspicua]|uniref:Phosphodiesterase n=1 Tax=Pichia inconspicua TaxID=52247 RepID=A0A4T0WYF9_9ASCO|nr:hypothetical protein CANINC_003653 [[Candida] inconspicua]
MLHELLILSSKKTLPSRIDLSPYNDGTTRIQRFSDLCSLLIHLLSNIHYTLIYDYNTNTVEKIRTNDLETELNFSITLYIDPEFKSSRMSNDSIVSFLKFRFKHLNLIMLENDSIHNKNKLATLEKHISTRLRRMHTWCIYDSQIDSDLDSMFYRYSKEFPKENEIARYTNFTAQIIDFNPLVIGLSKPNDQYYIDAVNKWDFNAFEFNIDDLLHIGYLILKDYFVQNEESQNRLRSFLFFTRDNYRIGNPFHNFRHAIDVLQASYYFLKVLNESSNYKISHFDAFTLLLSSLGHDIGHPGVTNAFMSNLESPLTKEFPTSILENYHFLKFQKILIPFLEKMFADGLLAVDGFKSLKDLNRLNDLMYSTIIATDMAKHNEFVSKIKLLEDEFDNFSLLASILIKCADISNVCRPLNTSCKWGLSLGEEFKQIAQLEKYNKSEIKDLSLLDDEHIKNPFDKLIKNIDANEGVKLVNSLSKNQMFFINVFAKSFFTKVSQSIPQLNFLYTHLHDNSLYWESVES